MSEREFALTEFTIQDDFPPVGYEAWRELVEAELQGASFDHKLVRRTYEGIDIQPLYTRRDELAARDAIGLPGEPPFVRGARQMRAFNAGWDLRQEHAHPDPEVTHRAILDDLAGGVTSLLLRLDASAQAGHEPDAPLSDELLERDGLLVYRVDELESLLDGVNLAEVGVALEAGAAFLPAAALLASVWSHRGVTADQARGAFHADPFGTLSRDGRLPYSPVDGLKMLGELAAWTSARYPGVTAVAVDTAPYHHAGATAVQDIAFALGTGVAYLRAMGEAGLDLEQAARQITFDFRLGTHHFLAIAKLRAARRAWWRVIEAAGGAPAAGAMRLNARLSQRVLTQRDPYVNLLRNTVGVFAAGLGGADAITSVPFDEQSGPPDAFSRRIARNTLLILQEEAHLNWVLDPAGGSWYLDRLTEQLAARAWELFQQLEREGGMLAAIQSGWVARQIDSAFAPRAKDIARRKAGITGVSEFPDVHEQPIVRPRLDMAALRRAAAKRCAAAGQRPTNWRLPAQDRLTAIVAAAQQGATIGQLANGLGFHRQTTEIAPLVPRLFAEPFEELRDASDAWRATHGTGPLVFLANMGPVSHHAARAAYSKNFFEVGGFDVLTNDGFRDADSAIRAYRASGAPIAVICSSDKLYPEIVPSLAAGLKAAGAKSVVLAGNPGANEQAWREAGVDRFIFIRCDVLATLREVLRELGVLPS